MIAQVEHEFEQVWLSYGTQFDGEGDVKISFGREVFHEAQAKAAIAGPPFFAWRSLSSRTLSRDEYQSNLLCA